MIFGLKKFQIDDVNFAYIPLEEKIISVYSNVRILDFGYTYLNCISTTENFRRMIVVVNIENLKPKKIIKTLNKFENELRKKNVRTQIFKEYSDSEKIIYLVEF